MAHTQSKALLQQPCMITYRPEKAEKFLLLLRKGFDNSGLLVHNLAPF